MFAGGAAVASTSSVTAMIQQFEGEDSSSGQERSRQFTVVIFRPAENSNYMRMMSDGD